MSIVITGATGQLGRLVVEQLLAAGTPPDTIVATRRDTNKLTALSDDGVTVRRADGGIPGLPTVSLPQLEAETKAGLVA